jgi:hypothetical protein
MLHATLQESSGIMAQLFPDAHTGPFVELTFEFYNLNAKNLILSLKGREYWVSGPSEKAAFFSNEIQRQITPLIEELMLIYGPKPKGAISLQIQNFFVFQGGFVKLVNDHGYALIKAISGDNVIAQFGNGDFHLCKHDVLTKYTTFVTDLVALDPVDEAQLRLSKLSFDQAS